jgi:aryl-alcohol dehydrogenase-like predicted oxidoreductase
MKYRKMGRTGLNVSEISLGSWLTYGNSTEKQTAIDTIHRAYELGINFFDTANVYNRGEAEKVVGEALRRYPRESYVVATKVFGSMGEGPNDRGLSRKHIMEQAHGSLRRLGLDNIDIYYCHRYDKETPLDETLRAFEDLITQGKVHYIGISEWTAAQIEEGIGLAEKHLWNRIVVNQPVYNMLNRYIEQEVIPVSAKHGISQVVFSPLAQGVLTGKYKPGKPLPEGSRATDPKANMSIGNLLKDDVLVKVQQLGGLADELGVKLSQLAIAWILQQSNVCSALVGASRPEQIEENAAASGVVLGEEVWAKIEEILK